MKKTKLELINSFNILKALAAGVAPDTLEQIHVDYYLKEGLSKKTNHCPYLSMIGEKDVLCSLEFKRKNELKFNSRNELESYTDNICFNDFMSCKAYKTIHKEELEEGGKIKNCGYCCNSTRQFLKICGTGKTFCIVKQKLVDDFNSDTICDMFNCYFGGHLHE